MLLISAVLILLLILILQTAVAAPNIQIARKLTPVNEAFATSHS